MLKRIKSWLTGERASAAIEFALVGLPFITMLIGITEVSLFFASGVVLEGSANEAARLIRTGQVQSAANPLQTFLNGLCAGSSLMITCGDIEYEVLAIPNNSFVNAQNMAPTFDANGNLVSGGFTPGGPNQDILVRVVYRYQFLTPFMGSLMTGNPTSNVATLMSTVVIQNEPYAAGS